MKIEGEQLKFGGILRQIREDRDLSMRAFSRACGLSAMYISDLENNNRKATLNVINAISNKMFLNEDEHQKMMDAYSHDRLQIPVELLYYLIDNDLLESVKTFKEYDENGMAVKQFARTLKKLNKINRRTFCSFLFLFTYI